jgi:hypothetical protein
MSIKSALIIEGEPMFLVVAVPQLVLADPAKAEQTVRFFQRRLSGLLTALVTCDVYGVPTAYFGRADLATQLLRISPTALPWKDLPFR